MLNRMVFILLIIAVFSSFCFAQDKETAKEQAKIILTSLNQNNTIKNKIRENCVIAVLYNPQSPASENEKSLIVKSLEDNKNIKIHNKKISIIEIPMDLTINLEKKIIIKKINAFWLSSDLDRFMNNIRESARYNQVTTISTDENMVTNSLVAMGIQKTENGYKLVINKHEASNINVDLNQDLLSQSIVIE
jgi:hypothetical protein